MSSDEKDPAPASEGAPEEPAAGDPVGVVDPKWVVRLDVRTTNGKVRIEHRVSDASDLQVALSIALSQVTFKHAMCAVERVEAFALSTKALVPHGAFG